MEIELTSPGRPAEPGTVEGGGSAAKWSFRLRFKLGDTARLPIEEAEWIVQDSEEIRVALRPVGDPEMLSEARRLDLEGAGYATMSDAESAGERWRDWFTVALASVNIGVDFGDRAQAAGGFTSEFLEYLNGISGSPVRNEVHGLDVYQGERPAYASISADGTASSSRQSLKEALDRVIASPVRLKTSERLAYDLYSASFSENSADARFVTLMMAIETLLERQLRSADARNLIEEFSRKIEGSSLEAREVGSIVKSLEDFRNESIGQAGRRLVARLGDKKYNGEKPKVFFTNCYEIRSFLVHGAQPRPLRSDVNSRAAELERFVADLICLSYVQNE
jgi:hypothetical protein